MHVRPPARSLRLGQLTAAAAAATLLACAGLLPIATAAHGQAPPDTARIRLDSLQVPVTRSAMDGAGAPLSLSLVGRARIQDGRPTATLDEALSGVPGLVVSNRQNYSLGPRIIMRGMGARAAFGVRGVRVLVDGIPLTMPDGQTNLNNLDLGSAGAIHVLRGPASALFGNAAGGVIAVETEPVPGPFAAEARIVAGDQGSGEFGRFRKAQAKVGQTVGRADYIASISSLRSDGYRDHSRSEQTLFNGRAGMAISGTSRVSFILSVMDMPVAQNPGSLPLDSATANPRMAWPANARLGAGEQTRHVQAGLRLQRIAGRARSDVSTYGVRRSLLNPLPFGVIDLERMAGGVRALHEHRFERPWLPVLTAGADVELQRDDRREFANVGGQASGPARRDQEDRVSTVAPFAQLRVGARAFAVTGGLRYDVVRFEVSDRRGVDPDRSGGRTLDAVSSMLGVAWTGGRTTLYANAATAFQTPTTTELINAPPAAGEACCPAGFNPDLEPQRARSLEVGARGEYGRVSYGVAAYHMAVRDALVPFQVASVEGRDFFRNAARTRHRGVEVNGSAHAGDAALLTAAYTWTDVRFRADGGSGQFAGNQLPGVPAHRLNLGATLRLGSSELGVELDRTGRQYTDDANATAAPGVTRLDLRAQTTVRAGRTDLVPFAALGNLLDERYFGSVSVNAAGGRFFEPAPGRNLYVGATVRAGGWRR